ncbi:hypothetical protein Trydic_g23135 [Trypoxylus dichotomus]
MQGGESPPGSGLPRRKYGNLAELTFQGGIILWRPQIKYLGVILDSRVNREAHIHHVLDRGRQIFGTLYPLLIGRGKLDLIRKIRIYKPIVTYASAVWATATTTHLNKLQTFQNRMLWMALNAPWFIRNTTLYEDA